jgi:hypothetical protein
MWRPCVHGQDLFLSPMLMLGKMVGWGLMIMVSTSAHPHSEYRNQKHADSDPATVVSMCADLHSRMRWQLNILADTQFSVTAENNIYISTGFCIQDHLRNSLLKLWHWEIERNNNNQPLSFCTITFTLLWMTINDLVSMPIFFIYLRSVGLSAWWSFISHLYFFILLKNPYFIHGKGICCILSQCSVWLASFIYLEMSKRNAFIRVPFVKKNLEYLLRSTCAECSSLLEVQWNKFITVMEMLGAVDCVA